ncbi:MAG: Bax inhibitor-1 family protein [Candidatus Sumerlaeaceae bacterium]|nr:Bax inhibitor-1 family protein [Candidatus Sumerlaeaceae bacterium]
MTLFVGIAIAVGCAFFALSQAIDMLRAGQTNLLTKLVTAGSGYWIVFIVYIVLAMAAGASARVKGLNVLLYSAFTAVTGFLISPLFYYAFVSAGQQYGIIWNAFGITALVFGSLTGYVFISGRDSASWVGSSRWASLCCWDSLSAHSFSRPLRFRWR